MNKIIVLLYLAFLLKLSACSQPSYEINIHITGNEFSGSTSILGYYYGSTFIQVDTIKLNQEGKGIFSGSEPLHQGMYYIDLAGSQAFDILVSEDQKFSILFNSQNSTYTADGSVDNSLLFSYQRYIVTQGHEINKLIDKRIRSPLKEEQDSIQRLIQVKTDSINLYTKNQIKENQNTFFASFLNATLDVEMPSETEMASLSITPYVYYTQHYFDNFDISDVRLLRTPVYNNKIEYYITNVVAPVPDSLKKAVDFLLETTKENEELYKNMMSFLLLYSLQNEQSNLADELFVYLTERHYIPNATWAPEEYITLLEKKKNEKKRILIGKVAPDFEVLEVEQDHFVSALTDTMCKADTLVGNPISVHEIDAEYTILYFWEADCGHCKEATPELYKIYLDKLQHIDLKIISIQTLTGVYGKTKWIDFINKHQIYKWINAWQPNEYNYREVYDLRYSPVLYILDKKKTIIGKNITPKQVEEIIRLHKVNKL